MSCECIGAHIHWKSAGSLGTPPPPRNATGSLCRPRALPTVPVPSLFLTFLPQPREPGASPPCDFSPPS